MKNILRFILFLTVFLLVYCGKGDDPQASRYSESDYIFSGKLLQNGTSTMPSYVKDPNASIVQVEEVLKVSAGHEDFKGQQITVVLNEEMKKRMKTGTSGIFFTKTWLFGKSLAVLGRDVDLEMSNMDKIREEISKYDKSFERKKLAERIQLASSVIHGAIEKVEDVKRSGPQRDSEHDPEFKTAQLKIISALKGEKESESVSFYFASSGDIMWERSPKFKSGEKGIFLLQRSDTQNKDLPVYTLLDPQDFQPESQLELVKEILK